MPRCQGLDGIARASGRRFAVGVCGPYCGSLLGGKGRRYCRRSEPDDRRSMSFSRHFAWRSIIDSEG